MAAVVTADSGKAMGEAATLKVFFYNHGNNRSPESIFPYENYLDFRPTRNHRKDP